MKATCDLCLETKEVRRFDLYITGSEGTRLCNDCERLVVRFIQDKRLLAFRKRKEDFLKRRREAKQ